MRNREQKRQKNRKWNPWIKYTLAAAGFIVRDLSKDNSLIRRICGRIKNHSSRLLNLKNKSRSNITSKTQQLDWNRSSEYDK